MPFLILPFFALGALVAHAFHSSVQQAAHEQRMQEKHAEHEARLQALEEETTKK